MKLLDKYNEHGSAEGTLDHDVYWTIADESIIGLDAFASVQNCWEPILTGGGDFIASVWGELKDAIR